MHSFIQGRHNVPLNHSRRYIDSLLNAEGVKQAQILAHRLKRCVFTHVYSSDLTRCKQTAELIHKNHSYAKLKIDSRLREQDLGDLTGMRWRDAKKVLRAEDRSLEDHLAEMGESLQNFDERVIDLYSDVLEQHLLVPHQELLEKLGLSSPTMNDHGPLHASDEGRDDNIIMPSPIVEPDDLATLSPTSATTSKPRRFRAASMVAGPAINAAKAAAQKAAVAVGLMSSPSSHLPPKSPSSPLPTAPTSPVSPTSASYSTAPASARIKSPLSNLKQASIFGSLPMLLSTSMNHSQKSDRNSINMHELSALLKNQSTFAVSSPALVTIKKPPPPRIQPTHILIVTHGGWIQRLMYHLLDELQFNLETDYAAGFPKNTGIYRFVISQVFKPDGDYEWEGKVTLMNDVSHMAHLTKKTSMDILADRPHESEIGLAWTPSHSKYGSAKSSPNMSRKKHNMPEAPSKTRTLGW
ncbi:hypothetical protein SeLEV6574_g07882 [Synchytrium endobioticum]|uniref:Uncharacterized protein n=1 Tax=Synchytrium endobioticum TaxID=286115 RepID=A0A507CDR9_9FUNG|nr:hypothetical protein SeLEV6574_g07882 [Synchytrium endobioticum]